MILEDQDPGETRDDARGSGVGRLVPASSSTASSRTRGPPAGRRRARAHGRSARAGARRGADRAPDRSGRRPPRRRRARGRDRPTADERHRRLVHDWMTSRPGGSIVRRDGVPQVERAFIRVRGLREGVDPRARAGGIDPAPERARRSWAAVAWWASAARWLAAVRAVGDRPARRGPRVARVAAHGDRAAGGRRRPPPGPARGGTRSDPIAASATTRSWAAIASRSAARHGRLVDAACDRPGARGRTTAGDRGAPEHRPAPRPTACVTRTRSDLAQRSGQLVVASPSRPRRGAPRRRTGCRRHGARSPSTSPPSADGPRIASSCARRSPGRSRSSSSADDPRVAFHLGEPRPERMAPVQLVGAVGGDDEQALRTQACGQEREDVTGRAVRPVEILEDEDDRRARAESPEEGEEPLEQARLCPIGATGTGTRRRVRPSSGTRRASSPVDASRSSPRSGRGRGRARAEPAAIGANGSASSPPRLTQAPSRTIAPRVARARSELRHEPSLADARLATDEDDRGGAVRRPPSGLRQGGQLRIRAR